MEDMHPDIMAMPRIKFVCGRDWLRGPRCWEIGVLWDANPWPRLGELIYRKHWIVRVYLDDSRFW